MIGVIRECRVRSMELGTIQVLEGKEWMILPSLYANNTVLMTGNAEF